MRRRTRISRGASSRTSRLSDAEPRIDALATRLIEAIRSHAGGLGGIEDFLHAYSLSTQEGLALMVLAEALLRVPDADTTDRLIEDKLAGRDWSHPDQKGDTLLVAASAWTLGISARLITPGQTPENIIESLTRRIGLAGAAARDPAGDAAARLAFRAWADDRRGAGSGDRPTRSIAIPSTCWARARAPATDAERYFHSYAHAIDAIGKSSNATSLHERPGISVKLSALHPRYEAVSRDRVMPRAWAAAARTGAQGESATTCLSLSMPKKPTAWNCRST